MSDATTADDLPLVFDHAGADAGTPVDALDVLEAGDRVLWGDRTQPCTVARVVTPDDRVGQALTVSVIGDGIRRLQRQEAERKGVEFDPDDFALAPGDVYADPRVWGKLTGKTFAVIQGPQGGFYALAEPENGRTFAALHRAVRSFHSTKRGRPGQGAWDYETDIDGRFRIVEHGEAPDELDPVGDLPAYDDIKDNRVMGYDVDAGEHYVVADTLDEAFDLGLGEAHKRAQERFKDEAPDADEDDIPTGADPERVAGTPDGASHSTATVTEIVDTEYGKKGAIEGPAPWDTPDGETPINVAIKALPWPECHYEFDPDREAWLVDATELAAVASELRDEGFAVRVEYDTDELHA